MTKCHKDGYTGGLVMLRRLTISFTEEERNALQQMAEYDFRPPKDQMRWLLRQEAQRRGLLPTHDTQEAQTVQDSRNKLDSKTQ